MAATALPDRSFCYFNGLQRVKSTSNPTLQQGTYVQGPVGKSGGRMSEWFPFISCPVVPNQYAPLLSSSSLAILPESQEGQRVTRQEHVLHTERQQE